MLSSSPPSSAETEISKFVLISFCASSASSEASAGLLSSSESNPNSERSTSSVSVGSLFSTVLVSRGDGFESWRLSNTLSKLSTSTLSLLLSGVNTLETDGSAGESEGGSSLKKSEKLMLSVLSDEAEAGVPSSGISAREKSSESPVSSIFTSTVSSNSKSISSGSSFCIVSAPKDSFLSDREESVSKNSSNEISPSSGWESSELFEVFSELVSSEKNSSRETA